MQVNDLTPLEKVLYTLRPTNAVMQLHLTGDLHDQTWPHPRAPYRAENHLDA